MKLHFDKNTFIDALEFTSSKMGISPIYVEKDYWLTYALFTIFNNEIGKDTVFKGGTALSKCYNILDRFSEDIDLVVIRREGETDSKLKSKLKTISKVVEITMPEVPILELTHKMGMNRKTAHNYNKIFTGNFGSIRDVIVLEATWLGYYEPYTTKSVISFVGQSLLDNKQDLIAEEYGLLPFEVLALEPSRTICEKIMSLIRFSYGEDPIMDLKNKIRHTYDLHRLLLQDEVLDFFHSKGFDEMLLKVANDDVLSFRNNNRWLIHHPSEALVFKDLENVWSSLKSSYSGSFKNLVYGDFPKEDAILNTLKLIQKRLQPIVWDIKIAP